VAKVLRSDDSNVVTNRLVVISPSSLPISTSSSRTLVKPVPPCSVLKTPLVISAAEIAERST